MSLWQGRAIMLLAILLIYSRLMALDMLVDPNGTHALVIRPSLMARHRAPRLVTIALCDSSEQVYRCVIRYCCSECYRLDSVQAQWLRSSFRQLAFPLGSEELVPA